MKSLIRISIYIVICLVSTTCHPSESKKSSTQASPEDNQVPTGKFIISGAYGLYPIAVQWVDAYKEAYPEISIQVIRSGTGKGIDELLAGEVQLAMISRELNSLEIEQGLNQVPVAKDAVVLVMNANNPNRETILRQGLDPRKLVELYTSGESFSWGQVLNTEVDNPVKVFTRADASGAAEVFANFLMRTSAEMKGVTVTGDEEMIEMIRKNPGSIGYCNLSYAYDSENGNQIRDIQVIPIDADMDGKVDRAEQPYLTIEKMHRAMWLGLYPKNLCRRLSFVYMDQPLDPQLMHFLKWVLQDGQELVEKSGCCQFNNVEIENSLKLLEQ